MESSDHPMFVRSSKFRHVFGSAAKKEHCYEGIRVTKSAHDANFCAVNHLFLAVVVESAGGGAFVVISLDKTGRVDVNSPKICGHRSPITDIKWNPFDSHAIASASEDATIKLWRIPKDGLTENVTDWFAELVGHNKKVNYIEWHPSASDILLSAGADFQCIVWNTATQEAVTVVTCHRDAIYSISWNRDGSAFATTCKDRILRVIDPRSGDVVAEGEGHQGTKASKVIFLEKNRLFTTGFSKHSERQYALWNTADLSKQLTGENIDSSSGLLIPFYDHDTSMVYLAGKGDGNIRYYEIVDSSPYVYFLSQYQSAAPQRGLGIMPKYGVDVTKCEIARFYKLHTQKDICEPISMIVPRKSEMYQTDIYPPTACSQPALTAEQWISGVDRDPLLMSVKDGILCSGSEPVSSSSSANKKLVVSAATSKSYPNSNSSPNSMGQQINSRRTDVKFVPLSTLLDSSPPKVAPTDSVVAAFPTTTSTNATSAISRSVSSSSTVSYSDFTRGGGRLFGDSNISTSTAAAALNDRPSAFNGIGSTNGLSHFARASAAVDSSTKDQPSARVVGGALPNAPAELELRNRVMEPMDSQARTASGYTNSSGVTTAADSKFNMSSTSAMDYEVKASRATISLGLAADGGGGQTQSSSVSMTASQVSSPNHISVMQMSSATPPSSGFVERPTHARHRLQRNASDVSDLSTTTTTTPLSVHVLKTRTRRSRHPRPQQQDDDSSSCSSTEAIAQNDDTWCDNPVYTTHHGGGGGGNSRHHRHVPPARRRKNMARSQTQLVDTGPLDDLLAQTAAERDRYMSRSNAELHLSSDLSTSAADVKSKAPEMMTSLHASPFKSEPDVTRTMTLVGDDVNTDGGRSTMIDCISVEAPDDTLIKPSRLRASMNSRHRRVPTDPSASVDDISALSSSGSGGAAVRRVGSVRETPPPRRTVNDATNGNGLGGLTRGLWKTASLREERSRTVGSVPILNVGKRGSPDPSEGLIRPQSPLSPLVTSTQTVVLQGAAPKIPLAATAVSSTSSAVTSSRDKYIFTVPGDAARRTPITLNHDILPTFNRSLSNTSSSGSNNLVSREPPVLDGGRLLHTTASADYEQLLRDYQQLQEKFVRQQDELLTLREQGTLKDIKIRRLEDQLRMARSLDNGTKAYSVPGSVTVIGVKGVC